MKFNYFLEIVLVFDYGKPKTVKLILCSVNEKFCVNMKIHIDIKAVGNVVRIMRRR